jgi:flagellar motility protein MotE (MotC chaperone)
MIQALLDEQAMIEELCAHYGDEELVRLIAEAKTDRLIDLYNDMPNGKRIN